jgi:hypothetical protein
MQKSAPKILLLIISFLFFANANFAQVSHYRLQQADSLFAAKRYTLALAQYEGVINNNEYSPALLLKMAYLHEALGHIAKTQYFLNLYLLSTNDDSVLEKMEALANKHNLQGYALTDKDRVLIVYRRFQKEITLILISIVILCQALLVYRKRSSGKQPIASLVGQLIMCVALAAHLYINNTSHASIVMSSNIYLMSGPSAGADVVEIIEEGHRFNILSKKDVWVKVQWNEQYVFIKEEFLQSIVL